jgi:hypothetical protein
VRGATDASSEAVELARIVVENLRDRPLRYPTFVAPAPQDLERIDIGGLISVAVIGADEEMIFRSETQNIRDVLQCLTGDKQTVLAKQTLVLVRVVELLVRSRRACSLSNTNGIQDEPASMNPNRSFGNCLGSPVKTTE